MTQQADNDPQRQVTRQQRDRLAWLEQALFTLVGGGAVLGLVGGLALPIWSVQSHGGDNEFAPDLVVEHTSRLLGLPGEIGAISRIVQEVEDHDPTPHVGTLPTIVIVATAVLILASILAILNCEVGTTRRFRSWYSIVVWSCAAAVFFVWVITWIYGRHPDTDDSVDLAAGGLYALTFGAIMAVVWSALSRSYREQGFADATSSPERRSR